jgi:hypothetical protein
MILAGLSVLIRAYFSSLLNDPVHTQMDSFFLGCVIG